MVYIEETSNQPDIKYLENITKMNGNLQSYQIGRFSV